MALGAIMSGVVAAWKFLGFGGSGLARVRESQSESELATIIFLVRNLRGESCEESKGRRGLPDTISNNDACWHAALSFIDAFSASARLSLISLDAKIGAEATPLDHGLYQRGYRLGIYSYG